MCGILGIGNWMKVKERGRHEGMRALRLLLLPPPKKLPLGLVVEGGE